MNERIIQTLLEKQLISVTDQQQIRKAEKTSLFSLHWEIKTILYLGILLLNIGLSLLSYLNIDTIGHQAIIALIAGITIGCFWYAHQHKAPFTTRKAESPSPFFDYIVLLGCFTFLIMEGYLQYHYTFFGEKYGLATFIPMVLFFYVAYYFDHRGALSLGITALGSWLGIAVTPMDIFQNNDFSSARLIYTGLLLGAFLCGIAFYLAEKDIKKHFSFTYLNFGVNVLFIACLSGLMILDMETIFFMLLAIITVLAILYAKKEKSFYFLIIAVIYAYWGVSYLVWTTFDTFQSELIFYYFIFSCGGVLYFLSQYKKFLNITNE